MSRLPFRIVVVSAAALLLGLLPGIRHLAAPAINSVGHAKGGADVLANLPLSFIENRGQADPRVAYYLQGADTSAYFTSRGLTLQLAGRGVSPGWTLRQRFVGATPAQPDGQNRAAGVVSYFKGSPDQWHTDLPTYSTVAYRDLWPGIDLVYRGDTSQLKYSFVVHPGGDPSDIRMAWDGAAGVAVTERGQLRVSTPTRAFLDDGPVSFQPGPGTRATVPTAYEVEGHTYGFDVGPYDPARALVIDPAILLYAGFIGGSDTDTGWDIEVDAKGAAYVAGSTGSTEATFPEKVGPDLTFNGDATDVDAFVAKVNPAGTALIYAGFIGGGGSDEGFSIAVDSDGAAYVTGSVRSEETSFPEKVGPDLTFNGEGDAYVAKVNPSGTDLVYAGYIGGSSEERGFGIAVDDAGAAYVTGSAVSTESTFPDKVGPDLSFNGGTFDAFVAKVNSSGSDLVYAGYVGGTGDDFGYGMDVDAAGNAYVSGTTNSHQSSFPEKVGPDLTYNGTTDVDVFAAKVNPSGSDLVYAGYIGGSATDIGRRLAVGDGGAAYVTGYTASTQTTFPEKVGPDLTANGGTDAFVAKVQPSGAGLVYAGFIGGSAGDFGAGIAVDPAGAAYAAGSTASTQATFPEKVGPDLTFNGGDGDAYVAKVNPSGTDFVYAGYIGGAGDDFALGNAVDRGGNAFVAGGTDSGQATFPEKVGPDLSANGDSDAFVAEVETTERCLGKPATVLGSSGGDVLSGTGKADVIKALGGADTVAAKGAGDRVCGGGGGDTLKGNAGNDILSGQGGNDALKGGPGTDTCKGGPGKDTGSSCEKGQL